MDKTTELIVNFREGLDEFKQCLTIFKNMLDDGDVELKFSPVGISVTLKSDRLYDELASFPITQEQFDAWQNEAYSLLRMILGDEESKFLKKFPIASKKRRWNLGTSLIAHFLETLAYHARMNLHARVVYGRDDHHQAEALFKALGRALGAATRIEPRRAAVPSTKGIL